MCPPKKKRIAVIHIFTHLVHSNRQETLKYNNIIIFHSHHIFCWWRCRGDVRDNV